MINFMTELRKRPTTAKSLNLTSIVVSVVGVYSETLVGNVVLALKVNNKDVLCGAEIRAKQRFFLVTTQDCSFDAILHLTVYSWLQLQILTAKVAPPSPPPHNTIIRLSLRGIIFFSL